MTVGKYCISARTALIQYLLLVKWNSVLIDVKDSTATTFDEALS